MDVITGVVENIKFSNGGGWTVAEVEDGHAPFGGCVTIVGIMPGLLPGMTVSVQGEWDEHPRFGKQLKVKSYQTQAPQTGPALEIFLQEVVYGIGTELARRIVSLYGEGTAEAMASPDLLKQVEGIGAERANRISESWREHQHERAALEGLLSFLVSNDIPTGYARKIFDEFGFTASEKIEADPYQLVKIDGISFKRADAIAMKLGFKTDSPERIRAALVYTIEHAKTEGHCYLDEGDLVQRVGKMTFVEDAFIDTELSTVLAQEDSPLVSEGEAIYSASLFEAERYVAENLLRLRDAVDERMVAFKALARSAVLKDLPKVEFDYTDQQIEAIWTALTEKVSIITGGPGTGKTTLVNAIVKLAGEVRGYPVMLVSPTGKAAKRLSEVTGRPASTIHRALGTSPTGGFLYDDDNPFSAALIVIDETSMLDISLARWLLRAIPEGAHVVFVGDVDQLPAVGPGNVLRDLLACGEFPVTRLEMIHRQDAKSLIIPNAHAINHGEMPKFANGNGGDFYLFGADNAETAGDWIVSLVTDRIPNTFGIDPADVQVLCPMHAGAAGDNAINARLQAALNPPSTGREEAESFKRTFRVGDRVIQVKNNYDLDVFNGDLGRIVRIGKNEKDKQAIWIEFDDGQTREYAPSDLAEVKHAYALTVHKSQGSEFPVVVMPVLTQHYVMLQRNLVYTGVTRAKQLVVLVGNRRALGIALDNASVKKRNTRLQERIRLLSQQGEK